MSLCMFKKPKHKYSKITGYIGLMVVGKASRIAVLRQLLCNCDIKFESNNKSSRAKNGFYSRK